ncbi:dTDP-glucose 4,6-dehydratase [Prochlorococcus marinus]|uniref:dTDP-glucose 4,6-dehydratase n=1 Tax=Prochlorococcus marinus TaxID=1219 RepID=UPI0022B417C7|nr:GDP-mannose 4,6-dehydratase [Prochlorococcus marinus]
MEALCSLDDKNILVTGGAGFIGSHLIDLIVKQENPKKVVVASNFFLGRLANLSEAKESFPDLIIERCDVGDFEEINEVILNHSIDIVFNLATIPLISSLTKPEWSLKKNLDMTINICKLLREEKFASLIQYSSSEALGTVRKLPMGNDHPSFPETPYAASKLATDHIALSYFNTFGCDVAVIRPFNQYGPRQNAHKFAALIPILIKKMRKDEDIFISGDGLQTRDFIFVKDTVKATLELFKHPQTRGKIIHIGSGKEISVLSVVKKVASLMNYTKEFKFIEKRKGDVRRHCADISEANQLINWTPQTNFNEGIKETVEWYKSHPEAFQASIL